MAQEEKGEDYPDKGLLTCGYTAGEAPTIASPLNNSNDNLAERVRDEAWWGERRVSEKDRSVPPSLSTW